jgi:hypothetical protein
MEGQAMALKPDDKTPGLWRGDPPVAAGAHALVIGISDYPYLGGGSAPDADRAPDNGGLAQLEVSALSGALFFGWLRLTGEIAGAPVATCRLLLAPRPDEQAEVDRLTEAHYGSADYEPMRSALIGWGDDTAAGGRSGEPNVAVFFFSGHGVEVAASPAILAHDVLNQRAADGGANKALAVDPMSTAIKTYNINRGLLFVDACRDSPQVARLLNLVGDQPLKPNPSPGRRPDALIRLQSTASGLKSYQAKQDPGTIFTQALLDGLDGPPPSYLPYDTKSTPWQLLFSALEGHVKRKVVDLLAGHTPLALQSVEPYGNPYNGLMLVARKVAPVASVPAVETRDAALVIRQAIEESAARILGPAFSMTARHIDLVRGLFESPLGDLENPNIMHPIFGHESITEPWIDSLSFVDAQTGEPADTEIVRIIGAYSEEIDTRVAAWIDMAVTPNAGGALWIGAGGDKNAGTALSAVVIPQDRYHPIPARLDVMFDRRDGPWVLSSMSARLCDPAKLAHLKVFELWAPLWEAQRTEALADLASAGRTVEQRLDLRSVVDDKSESPVAAALAINYLLRSGDVGYLLDWPRNLANWFEWLPDGPVLWAETLLRLHEIQTGAAAPDVSGCARDDRERALQGFLVNRGPFEALEYFLKLAERGAPLLASSLAIALRQAVFWRQVHDAGVLPHLEHDRLAQALEKIQRAGRYAVSGGGFARFVSPDGMMSPQLVFGPRRRRTAARVALA